jgi:MoaA/NifB/PqqE/SkfB family radical SAM enzyme
MLVSWNCTNACNLSCPHCSRDAGQAAPRELSFQEGQRLIDGAAQAGFDFSFFSGGEALLRPDLPELVRYAASRGMRSVLGSNGTLLDEPIARTLQKAGLARAGLSLDSVRPKAHDLFRGVDGAWDTTVAACPGPPSAFPFRCT